MWEQEQGHCRKGRAVRRDRPQGGTCHGEGGAAGWGDHHPPTCELLLPLRCWTLTSKAVLALASLPGLDF